MSHFDPDYFSADIKLPKTVSVPYQQLVLRDIRIQGSVICSPEDAEEMIVAVDEMGGDIVETVPFDGLESITELLKTVRAGKVKGKAIIIVDRSQLSHD